MTAKALDIPFSEYLQLEGHNSSSLKEMTKSPRQYRHSKDNGRKDTGSFAFGRCTHTAILEPEKFSGSYICWSGGKDKNGDWTTDKRKAAAAWKKLQEDAKESGLEILDTGDFSKLLSMQASVSSNPDAHKLVIGSEHEVTITWRHRFGCMMKMRADMLNRKRFLADLKSAKDVHSEKFGRDANSHGYHQQLAMYQDGAEALTGLKLPVYIIAVEKEAPHDCVVYEVPEVALELGRSIYEENLAKVLRCEQTGHWPGCGEGIQTLELPNWAYEDNLISTLVMPSGEVVSV